VDEASEPTDGVIGALSRILRSNRLLPRRERRKFRLHEIALALPSSHQTLQRR